MKKLLLPLLILSLSLSLFACGDKDKPVNTTGTDDTGTSTTQKDGPIGPPVSTPVIDDEKAAYGLGDFVSYQEDDNFTYKVYKDGAAVSGFKGSGAAAIPATIGNSPVKVIAQDAFRGVTSMTSVTIPDSVVLIARNAFYQCSGLTSVTFPASCTVEDYAFAYDTALTEVSIPNATLGTGLFYGCTSLKSCTLPASMTVIPDRIFYGCTSLVYSIPSNVVTIGSESFFSCTSLTEIVIPNGVTAIGSSAFYNCSGVTTLTLPSAAAASAASAFAAPAEENGESADPNEGEGEEVGDGEGEGEGEGEEGDTTDTTGTETTPDVPEIPAIKPAGLVSIGDYAFYNLSGVTQVNIPNTVVYLGSYSFANTGLTSVDIPAIKSGDEYNFEGIGAVTSGIGSGAFANCLGLTQIAIPTDITSIPDMIIYGCSNITSVSYSDKITRIGSGAFAKTGLSSFHIPDTVTALGTSAFRGCDKLTDLVIGPKIVNISEKAFSECVGLTSVSIPASVTTIGPAAFSKCTGLTRVTFADSINTLFDRECFLDCPNLLSVEIPASNVKNFNSCCFGYISNPDQEVGGNIPLDGFKITGYIGGTLENYAKTYSTALTAYRQQTDPDNYPSDAAPVEDFFNIVGLVGYSPFADFRWDMIEPAESATGATAPEENSAPFGLIISKYIGSDADVKIPTVFRLNEKKEISLYGVDRRVVVIGSGAFEGNTTITSVTIPDSVEEIQADAFKDCPKLATADLRNASGLTSVGEKAFLNTSLFSVYLPSGLKAENIGKYAFCYVQTGAGDPTVAEVAYYKYEATEYVLDDEGNYELDDEGNRKTTVKTYETRDEVPDDAASVKPIPVPPTIYCNGAGGKAYATENGLTSASLPAEAA